MNRFKEEFGIDLAELDLDAVQARPRLDTTVQKSRVIVVHQVSAQRRLPAKVAQQLGSVYSKQRKLLHLMSTPGDGDKDVEPNYRTQKSAPEVLDEKPKSEEEVRLSTVSAVSSAYQVCSGVQGRQGIILCTCLTLHV